MKDEKKIGYMCSVDYDEHLEHDWHGVSVYTSIQSIKHHAQCVTGDGKYSCGIYKVEIKKVRTVKKEKLW